MGQVMVRALRLCVPTPDVAWESYEENGKYSRSSPSSFSTSDNTQHSTYSTDRCGVGQHLLPRTVHDSEALACYQCATTFSTMVRRHHCRRCRNIYCHKCSSHTDRLLLYGEPKPVRLCDGCAEAAPAENLFVEQQIPLLREGATLVRLALLARRIVHVRLTADLSVLEETETCRGEGRTHRHSLDEVEAVETGGSGGHAGVPPVLVIRLKGKGQLKLEACTAIERDLWVSALDAAVRHRRSPSLAVEIEQQRWARREEAELNAARRRSMERRRQNETARSQIAEKYGLDPNKYASRPPPKYDDLGFREEGGVNSGGGFRSGGFGSGGIRRAVASGGLTGRLPLMTAVAQH